LTKKGRNSGHGSFQDQSSTQQVNGLILFHLNRASTGTHFSGVRQHALRLRLPLLTDDFCFAFDRQSSRPRIDKRHRMSGVRIFSRDQVESKLNACCFDTTRIENTVLYRHQRQCLVGLPHRLPSLFLADPPDAAADYSTLWW
jgi:hypothetical protein